MELIRYDYDVVAERECDTFFFKLTANKIGYWSFDEPTREQHLAWFKDWDLPIEKVGFQGLLIGESGYYYVGFRDADDPRLDLWSKIFEDTNGNSKNPDKYQMFVYTYQLYLEHLKSGKFDPVDPEDW